MRLLPNKLIPASGFSHLIHLGLTSLLPVVVYVIIRLDFAVTVAYTVVLLGKWRMFSVRPRYWPANIRANAIDLMVNLSLVTFMSKTDSQIWQIGWMVAFVVWQSFLKPGNSALKVSLQALLGQTVALVSLFLAAGQADTWILVLAVWSICYLSARHFFTSFDEAHTNLYAYFWGYFAACLMWLLGHWLMFYGLIAMPTLLLTVIGVAMASLYYLDETDRLSLNIRRQIIFMMSAMVVILLVFSDWGDRAI